MNSDLEIAITPNKQDPPKEVSDDPEKKTSTIKTILIGVAIYAAFFCVFFLIFKFYPNAQYIFIDIIEEGGSGIKQVAVCVAFGCLLNMCGIPVSIYEMLLGFLWRSFTYAFFIGTCFRVLALSIGYFISKKYLKDVIIENIREFKFFRALVYMAKTKPMQTIFMIRFGYIPSFFKIYAPPILGFQFVHCFIGGILGSMFFSSINVSIGITAGSLTSVGEDDEETFAAKMLPVIVMVAGIIMQIVLFFYTRKVVNDLENLEGMDLETISKIQKFEEDQGKFENGNPQENFNNSSEEERLTKDRSSENMVDTKDYFVTI